MLKGIAASAGIAIGKAVIVRETPITVEKRTILHPTEEGQRFLGAIDVFVEQMDRASGVVSRNIGPDEANILKAQVSIVRDPDLIREVLRIIERNQVNAEYAFQMICNGYITLFRHHNDELMRARSADFEDIRDQMLRILLGLRTVDLTQLPEGSILVAEDIPPSQASGIDVTRIKGIVTQRGTRFSHIAIIARALRLPAVVAVPDVFEQIHGDETVIVDGHGGEILVRPAQAVTDKFRYMIQAEQLRAGQLHRLKDAPTCSADGAEVRLLVNLALKKELETLRDNNPDGIGLMRTEILYMERTRVPTEQEQYEIYKDVALRMAGGPAIIRTLDVGGDKDVPHLRLQREENPFLGGRGVRWCLANPAVFKTQLAALLRAAVYGDIRILVPMISSITELRRVKELLEEVRHELAEREETFRSEVPLGIMIETPAAALRAGDLAAECDFFSIGTNDLTQYTLAADRGNECVAALYDALHPAVLQLIQMTVQAAREVGISACVCGEAAGDPFMIPFLLGVGVDELSIDPSLLLATRSLIGQLQVAHCRKEAPAILRLQTPDDVRRHIAETLLPHGERP